jgi:DNA modification methylase
MTPHYTDPWLTVYLGDCREVMAQMEPESVHCVVTSPPFWGLRDYGVEGQLGLEPTPEEYVANMVAVFREVRRVLRSDGTVWLNLGDSYAAGGGSGAQRLDELGVRLGTGGGHKHSSHPSGRAPSAGLAQKQLVGIPWRVAFALQADGWYLRSDIIWSKPNPMPESVTDRPTKAHEYLFLLSKSPRYYYDADAVREPVTESSLERVRYSFDAARDRRANGSVTTGDTLRADQLAPAAGRNLRSVWTIATQPYPGAHFATFPPKLVEPCIKAGSPVNGVILDPFAGSGTTGMVAQSLSRRAVLIDLSADYLKQLMDRNRAMPLGLGA